MAARRPGHAAGHRPRPLGHRERTRASRRPRPMPYRVIARNLPGSAPEFFDFMSYCAGTDEVPSAGNAPQHVAVPARLGRRGRLADGVDEEDRRRHGARPAAGGADVPGADGERHRPRCGGGDPERRAGDRQPGRAGDGRAGAGRVQRDRSRGDAREAERRGARRDRPALLRRLGAALGVARVAIVDQVGTKLGERAQSAHAPTVSVTSPKAGATVGGTKVVNVALEGRGRRRRQALGDRRGLGRRRSNVATRLPGPGDHGGALPRPTSQPRRTPGCGSPSTTGSAWRPRSSGRFRTLAAPATVHIDSPRQGAKFDSDGSMSLAGFATALAGAGAVEPPGLEPGRQADRARREGRRPQPATGPARAHARRQGRPEGDRTRDRRHPRRHAAVPEGVAAVADRTIGEVRRASGSSRERRPRSASRGSA